MNSIKDWQKIVNWTAKKAGWYDDRLGELDEVRMVSLLALIGTEVSEAIECIRKGQLKPYWECTTGESSDTKPCGLPSELADIIIRTLDFAEAMKIDMEEAITIKNDYNLTRSKRHGGKAL